MIGWRRLLTALIALALGLNLTALLVLNTIALWSLDSVNNDFPYDTETVDRTTNSNTDRKGHVSDMHSPTRETKIKNGSLTHLSSVARKNTSSRIATQPTTTPTTTAGIPKIIWMFWDQGMEHLERLGQSPEPNKYQADYGCVQAWKLLHPTWEIRVLNRTEAQRIAPKFAHLSLLQNHQNTDARICPTKLSDLLRLELLYTFGGVYADTSVCPMRPLDDYMDRIVGPGGFFAPLLFDSDKAGAFSQQQLKRFDDCDRPLPPNAGYAVRKRRDLASAQSRSLSSFFLVAQPYDVLIQRWMEAYYQHMLHAATTLNLDDVCSRVPYYISHCILTKQLAHDKDLNQVWTQFRDRVIQEQGYWQHGDKEGLCIAVAGGSTVGIQADTNTKMTTNTSFTMEKCFFAKKQQGPLANFVKSPKYLEALAQRQHLGGETGTGI